MSLAKLNILLWKNWMLQRRRPFSTAFQILLPIVFVIFTAWLKSSFQSQIVWYFGNRIEGETFLTNFSACTRPVESVYFSPNIEPLDKLIKESFKNENFEILGFINHELLWDELFSTNKSVIGIFFTSDDSVEPMDMPKVLFYNFFEANPPDPLCNLMAQNVLERAFVTSYSDSSRLRPNIMAKSFPYENFYMQLFTYLMIYLIPIFLTLSMFSVVMMIVKGIVSERESRMKEQMKIMGLASILNWKAWFITSIIMTTITYTIVTVFLCFPIFGDKAVFDYSNFFIIWLFFFIYCIGVITFCFMISTFFRRSSSVSTIGTMLFFTALIPFIVFESNFESLHYSIKWFFLLPINTAFGIGTSMALNMEYNEKGINFSNLFSHYEGFNFSLGEVMIVMLLSIVIHILLTIYIEMVFPGEFGTGRPWHFVITCCFPRKDKNTEYYNQNINRINVRNQDFDEEPQHLSAKVRLLNMTKRFGSFTAVQDLSLNIYEGQITVLLGHNGGGKTTTMNVLTGMLAPTEGTAFINGYDIRTETTKARESLGLCPQHDVLFNDLTVREHIVFFCRLKGMTDSKAVETEVEKYLKLLDLMDKKDKKSRTLSGGQKRKLSIANALCGNSKFVILDEPTSGLDVSARRNLWNLLIAEKAKRTILLTTHYMDEAEVLGDRIAILSEGSLKTVGTSFFLKKKFGSGYRLIVVKEENCDSNVILDGIKKYANDTAIESDEQREVIYVLNDDFIDEFEKIFKFLEDSGESLGIKNFGCSVATLEDVFMKIGENVRHTTKDTEVTFSRTSEDQKRSALTLVLNQMYAQILKKFHFTRRYYIPLIANVLMTAWFMFVFLAGSLGPSFDFDSKPSVLVNGPHQNESLVQAYKSLFTGPVQFTERNLADYINGNKLHRNQKYALGVSFGDSSDSVWYDFFYFNSIFLTLNFYHRAILKESNSEYDIRPTFMSFMNSKASSEEITSNERNEFEDTVIYTLFFLLLMFWTSLHITIKVKERANKMKLLQFISGGSRFLYTFTSFLVDSLLTLGILSIVIGIVAATGRSGFDNFDDLIIHFVAITFYIINVVPFLYVMSFWFTKPSTSENVAIIFPMICGFIYMVYIIMDVGFQFENTRYITDVIADIIYWIGIFFGPFSFINIYNKIQHIFMFGGSEIWSFQEKGIGTNLVTLGCGSIVFLLIVFLLDYRFFDKISYKISFSEKKLPSLTTTDTDVLAEIERVKSKSLELITANKLVMKKLTKSYGNFVAVNQLYVAVEPAECFGLLGVNGAGKTSVFKMLTGDERITAGDSWVNGFSMKSNMSNVYQEFGYCPQHDALLFELTGRETIKIFCLIRGIPRNEIEDITKWFANELDFTQHLDKKVENYSGGNKRKLSVCLSLLGDPSLTYLDECSSGIDPKAKRHLWNAIKRVRQSGKAIVMSSHSMQECENLCTRLAIMVDGEFQCLGSIQHIKNKFSKGFVLKIMMSNRDDEVQFQKIYNQVMSKFPETQLKERFMGLITFEINLPDLKWSEVFAELSKMKSELDIVDYTLTQSSLEAVFLSFSKSGKRKEE